MSRTSEAESFLVLSASVGPRDVAEFFGISEPEDLAIRVRAAFENVNELLDALEIEKFV